MKKITLYFTLFGNIRGEPRKTSGILHFWSSSYLIIFDLCLQLSPPSFMTTIPRAHGTSWAPSSIYKCDYDGGFGPVWVHSHKLIFIFTLKIFEYIYNRWYLIYKCHLPPRHQYPTETRCQTSAGKVDLTHKYVDLTHQWIMLNVQLLKKYHNGKVNITHQ